MTIDPSLDEEIKAMHGANPCPPESNCTICWPEAGWPEPDESEPTPATCLWKQDEDGNWNTDCGDCWVLVEGAPKENRMRFCPYCGKSLRQRSYRD